MTPNDKELLVQENDYMKKELKERREKIEQLRQDVKRAYFDGYKQGRYDEQMCILNKEDKS
ncbi:hypothetical protein ACFSMW_06700 [Virgibacillus halophilus]|uniref:Fur-regulated basic protein B n=1 Tax=Tigheibacillus halophilus TaxID=361280 RepID=A0ABU5C6E5_9BACI|nr:hypothetical protein [Virgibacillus halophilus]